MTWTLTTSPTRPAASAPASTAARTAATSPRNVTATRPLPTLCCSTKVTLAALSAASHASTAATMPLVSIRPIASCVAMGCSKRSGSLGCCQDRHRLPGDDQFFVGRDDPDLRAALDGTDLGLAAADVVLLRV